MLLPYNLMYIGSENDASKHEKHRFEAKNCFLSHLNLNFAPCELIVFFWIDGREVSF